MTHVLDRITIGLDATVAPQFKEDTSVTVTVDGIDARTVVEITGQTFRTFEVDVPPGVSEGQVQVVVTVDGLASDPFLFHVPWTLSGSTALSANLDSSLINARLLEGSAGLSANLGSALRRLHELEGQAPLSANLDSDLSNTRTLAGTANLSANLSSTLSAVGTQQLEGTALLSANLETQLSRTHHLEGQAPLSGNLGSDLSRTHQIAGTALLSGNLDTLLNADDEPRRLAGTTLLSANLLSALVVDNVAPIIEPIPDQIQRIGANWSYQVIANDPEGQPLIYSLDGEPAGMTISNSGLIEWDVSGSSNVTYVITVNVSDGDLTSMESFSFATIPTWTDVDMATDQWTDIPAATGTWVDV